MQPWSLSVLLQEDRFAVQRASVDSFGYLNWSLTRFGPEKHREEKFTLYNIPVNVDTSPSRTVSQRVTIPSSCTETQIIIIIIIIVVSVVITRTMIIRVIFIDRLHRIIKTDMTSLTFFFLSFLYLATAMLHCAKERLDLYLLTGGQLNAKWSVMERTKKTKQKKTATVDEKGGGGGNE